MRLIQKPAEMQAYVKELKRQGKTVGLVPTMGFLHEGHISLVRIARTLCDTVFVSIFVNPIQFGVNEDFDTYPRNLDGDMALLQPEGVDVVFAPVAPDMYPSRYGTFVDTSGLDDRLCGKSRPGHFRGVTTVVSKLFLICQPDVAVFGQKDAQQVMIIEKMSRELNFPVQIVRGPIVREADGLAMSSRNVYLSSEDRQRATVLSRSLRQAQERISTGERNPGAIRGMISETIAGTPGARIDYVEVLSGEDLRDLETLQGKVLIALAVKFGETRLIDNLLLEV
ncbi:MAG: pantoate--beta-alanine ligase [Solirubrobacterales bacterium]